MSINEEQRIIVDQNQIKIGINYLHQLIFVINDRNVRLFFFHRFLNNSLRIVLETCVYRSSATSIFPLLQFDDLQARALTMKRSRQVPPSFLFSLICVEIVISSCTVCSVFFTLWLTIRRTLPSAVVEYATFRDLLSRKKKGTCSLWKILWWWTPRGRAEENIFAIQATIDHSHC